MNNFVASIGPGIFILAASYAGCDRTATVILFTVGMGFMGTFYCGMKVNALDLSPNYAGTLMAIVNGLGALSGIITPYLAGALTEDVSHILNACIQFFKFLFFIFQQTLSQWRTVFWITLAVLLVTDIIFVMFGSGEEQWWNSVSKNESVCKNDVDLEKHEKYIVKRDV